MKIRYAKKADVPAILKLLSQVLLIHHKARRDIFKPSGTKYTEEELFDIIKNEKTPVFVAEIDTRVVGYCFCVIYDEEENNILLKRKDLYIDDLCIDENMRGKRVGQALFEHAESYAKKIGCNSVTLNVWSGNDGAIAFYEKMGMTPRKTLLEKRI